MSVEIPSDCTSIVEQLIANGSYRDEAAIVAAGIRLVAAKERLDADIEAGIRQLDAGERIPASEVDAKARERIRELKTGEKGRAPRRRERGRDKPIAAEKSIDCQ